MIVARSSDFASNFISPPIIAILRTGVDFFFFPFAEGGNLASGTVIGSVILIREEEERE